jgi:hypothetical protein
MDPMTSELVYGVVVSGPRGDGTRTVDTEEAGRINAFVRGNSVDVGTPVLITRVTVGKPAKSGLIRSTTSTVTSLWVIVEPDNMDTLDPCRCVECDNVLTQVDAVPGKPLGAGIRRCREHRLAFHKQARDARAA